jgi:hypothetical protein
MAVLQSYRTAADQSKYGLSRGVAVLSGMVLAAGWLYVVIGGVLLGPLSVDIYCNGFVFGQVRPPPINPYKSHPPSAFLATEVLGEFVRQQPHCGDHGKCVLGRCSCPDLISGANCGNECSGHGKCSDTPVSYASAISRYMAGIY